MKGKVSIIVPVYKVEEYLDECVESLLRQTYPNIEILLIDDESPDQCPQICDQWAARDSRVRVIHKKNGGAASARNAGLDAASGTYVCFVDSDDVVLPSFIQELLSALQDSNADIAVCGFELWSKTARRLVTGLTEPGIYRCEDYLCRFLSDWSCSLLWNKLYLRKTIGRLRMDEGHRVDDEFFTYRVVMQCRSVAVCASALYRYRLRASSAMQDTAEVKEKMMLDRILYVTTRYRAVSEKFPELEPAFFHDTLDTLLRYRQHSKNMPQAIRMLRQWVWHNSPRLLSMDCPLRQKLAFLYLLILKAPQYSGEANPLQQQESDYFP